MRDKPKYVIQPYLPLLDEFIPYLKNIWDSNILTNFAPIHQQFEEALGEFFGLDYTGQMIPHINVTAT